MESQLHLLLPPTNSFAAAGRIRPTPATPRSAHHRPCNGSYPSPDPTAWNRRISAPPQTLALAVQAGVEKIVVTLSDPATRRGCPWPLSPAAAPRPAGGVDVGLQARRCPIWSWDAEQLEARGRRRPLRLGGPLWCSPCTACISSPISLLKFLDWIIVCFPMCSLIPWP